MSIQSAGEVRISNLRSKSFFAYSPEELDKELNAWLQAHSESNIVSMDTRLNEYRCWVVVLYRDKTAGVI